ncbi:MAG TPA: hypothetical protein VKA89_11105 [Solirubrobacterales bacterium]|nr:hypothetical protein [Solirubrobacterales bacterium]
MSRLAEITGRLQAITRELEAGVADEVAEELTREAADLAAEAAEEVNRAMRELPDEGR